MSVVKDDADIILLEQRFPPHKSVSDELGSDAELIVLDSVESNSTSCSVEEIVQCNDDSPVVCFPNENDKCGFNPTNELDSHLKDENILLLNEVNRLKEENKQLQNQLLELRKSACSEVNLCAETGIHSDGKSSQVQVIFKTEKMAKKYKNRVYKFLKKLLPKDLHFSVITSQTKNNEQRSDSNIFCFDTSPLSDHKNVNRKIPSYENSFETPMQKVHDVVSVNKNLRAPMCFNCHGDHMLSKCPEPWNQDRINESKKNYFRSNVTKSPRYHVEKQISDRFKPGEISENLRAALNLNQNQIPPYIYRMRSLGYPPGWMQEAQIESSGIVIYDSEGKAVVDDTVEDGEVDTSVVKVQYDPKKLVSYPGFNVPLPPGFIDESAQMGFPPMQQYHLKSEVEKHMKAPEAKAYKKRKLSPISSQRKKSRLDVINRVEDDMDIEDCGDRSVVYLSKEDSEKCTFVPPLPPNAPETPPPPPPPPATGAIQSPDAEDVSASRARDSPSLNDLEDAKVKLMKELDQVSDEVGRNSDGRSVSLFVSPGTPVTIKHSQFKGLPDSSLFAKGVSEHVSFENLPDSTGQYDRMRQLLGKIREVQKQHQ